MTRPAKGRQACDIVQDREGSEVVKFCRIAKACGLGNSANAMLQPEAWHKLLKGGVV